MHGSRLPFIQHKKLLRISLGVFLRHLLVPVADRQKRKSYLIEITKTIIGYIPPQAVVTDLVVLMPHILPVLRAPLGTRRDQRFHISYHFIDP